jgi:nucleoside-diphosphate-sugar epimerase
MSQIMYCVAKKLSEQAIWKFVEQEKPQFHVTVFNPPLLFAPMQQNVKSADKANFSMALIYNIMNSAKSETGTVPNTMFPGYIDMRDLAELHIAALTNPGAANKRFIVGFPIKFDQLAESLRKVPELKGRIGKNNDEEREVPQFDIADAEKVFGIKWRTLDETMADSARSLLKLE